MSLQISIDRGGTFTDVFIRCGDRVIVKKLLSENPDCYSDAPAEAIRRVLMEEGLWIKEADDLIPVSKIEWIRMGTTVATNALLERKGARCALLITEGFWFLPEIGDQTRTDLFALNIEKPEQLHIGCNEVEERIIPVNGKGIIHKRLNIQKVRQYLKFVYRKKVRSIAIVLMHSVLNAKHEKKLAEIASKMGFDNISVSHELVPSAKILPRLYTTILDSYLSPEIRNYLHSFTEQFAGGLQGKKLFMMQSCGGLREAENFCGANALLSGPAGGVIGAAKGFYQGTPLITFDMGGTSTDVSRYEGNLELSWENKFAGFMLGTPQLDIHTIAAGGGSRLFFRDGMFIVGPESSGADPGPVCYRKNGFLSITDANLISGRLHPDFFPQVFGPQQNQPLSVEATQKAFQEFAGEINREQDKRNLPRFSIEEIALGFIEVANENMARAIRRVSAEKGHEPSGHHLVCFGGAGGQHACAVARKTGIKKVLIHKYSGILSAWGLSQAELAKSMRQYLHKELKNCTEKSLNEAFALLAEEGKQEFLQQGYTEFSFEALVALKYEGTDTILELPYQNFSELGAEFARKHLELFDFLCPETPLILAELRLRIIVNLPAITEAESQSPLSAGAPEPLIITKTCFADGWLPTPVFATEKMNHGSKICGPALLMQDNSTILLEPGDEAVIDNRGNIIIEVAQVQRVELEEHQQAVNVSVFHSLFASVAEQMGRTLQRTSVSTNIRERLDFSCAIFDAKGNLVSNAPHIPVHLGSMSSCVRYLRNSVAEEEQQNRVFITNHPAQGGSHLPDITIITPVFHDGRICYYLANRGHHADIGGISPGSMPSNSRYLSEEGAVFSLFPVVEKNGFQGEKVAAVLQSAGARNIERNLSDIKAQISANQRGKSLLERIMPLYGRQTVLDYMEKIQQISKNAVLDFFRKKAPLHIREAEYMDSGMRLAVEIRFLPTDERVVFDFSQSSVPLFTNNQNAPEAITNSVLVYVLRLLLNKDLPLNDGFLQAVEIIHQRGSILSPLPESAVAGGNVTTSQRLVDLLLKAFRLCAASQGCMNNLSFGNKNFGYYETIGGGAGAGPGFHGADAVHTHMTNTRSTDPEIMELNYPLILRRFAFRQDSRWGNSEKDVPAVCVGRYYSGGVGIEKEIEFLEPVHISLLTERRVTPPFGLNGAPPGRCGENLLLRGDQVFFLGGRAEIDAQAHDRLLIRTPSGGCYLA